MKFTDSKIRALKPRSTRYELWEMGAKGFGLRISPHGRKSWVFMYWFEGVQ
ncbi:Arm DNA-binding domain-containing protein [Nitrospinaceae bacterium]|nr:Arm DNA-binding domain-containing protein [Nitrospinaceae bacterium]